MTKNEVIIKKYYPSFTAKAITFSIDDGNMECDKRFIDIVRPEGIKGTFNLFFGAKRELSDEVYRNFYEGYEIANHCNLHPFAIDTQREYAFSEEPFDAKTADKDLVYRTSRRGVWRIYNKSHWAYLADREAYLLLARECNDELEKIFGKGKIKGFVWPYGLQNDTELRKKLSLLGFQSIRKTYTPGFSLPKDRTLWGYNADSSNMDRLIIDFENLEDDGELKFFCFGVHSVDFERANKWEMLSSFAKKYGNRPQDFFYGSVGEIFDYEDAMNSLLIEDGKIYNSSDKRLYVSVNGKKIVLEPNKPYRLIE